MGRGRGGGSSLRRRIEVWWAPWFLVLCLVFLVVSSVMTLDEDSSTGAMISRVEECGVRGTLQPKKAGVEPLTRVGMNALGHHHRQGLPHLDMPQAKATQVQHPASHGMVVHHLGSSQIR